MVSYGLIFDIKIICHGCSFSQDLVKKYSEFINFPIYIWSTKEVDVEVPADEDESNDEEEQCMHHSNTLYIYMHFKTLRP